MWRLPMVGIWPSRANVVSHTPHTETLAHWTAHPARISFQTDSIDGLSVTSLTDTVADIARSMPLVHSVPMIDRAIAADRRGSNDVDRLRTTRQSIEGLIASGPAMNKKRAFAALNLANGLSGSAGESLSRVTMHVAGAPVPELQHHFRDAAGSMFADFWWPEFNVVGEFDGLGKYLRPEWAHLGTAEAVIREKEREDRIRALGPSVTRWGWAEARSPTLLADKLRRGGISW